MAGEAQLRLPFRADYGTHLAEDLPAEDGGQHEAGVQRPGQEAQE
jgi:hypothetical protein